MKSRQSGLTQDTSAAKAGISPRSGRRIEKNGQTVKKQRHWKTRKDPFSGIWEAELIPLLEKEPTLTGLTLWEYLDENHPQSFPYSLLRTLQRRVKHWRATQGPNNRLFLDKLCQRLTRFIGFHPSQYYGYYFR